MDIETPASTVIIMLVALSAAVTAGLFLLGAATAFFAKNRKIRVARQVPMRAYYGQALLGR